MTEAVLVVVTVGIELITLVTVVLLVTVVSAAQVAVVEQDGWQTTVLDKVSEALGCIGVSLSFVQDTPAIWASTKCRRPSFKEYKVKVHSISSSSSPRQSTLLAWIGLLDFP